MPLRSLRKGDKSRKAGHYHLLSSTDEKSSDLDCRVGSRIAGLCLRRKHSSCQKDKPLSPHVSLFPVCYSLAVQFITSVNLCTAETRWNTTQNNSVNSHAQGTTALQPTVFLTAIRRLLVVNTLLLPAQPLPKSALLL